MAAIALSVMQDLVVNANDTSDIVTLKQAYNNQLKSAQALVSDIGTNVNTIQNSITALNETLLQINGLANGLNTLQPQAQVYGSQTQSSMVVAISGQVMMI